MQNIADVDPYVPNQQKLVYNRELLNRTEVREKYIKTPYDGLKHFLKARNSSHCVISVSFIKVLGNSKVEIKELIFHKLATLLTIKTITK